MTPELVADVHAELGEGPAWDARGGVLWWVDITGRSLHAYDPATGRDEIRGTFDDVLTAVVPRRSGGLVLTLGRSFVAYDPDSGVLQILASVEPAAAGNRMNDGKVDRQGRFWAGTMAVAGSDSRGAGSLYRLELDGTATRVLGDVTISNGLAWSVDDTTFFYVDSPTQEVAAFRFDPTGGHISQRRVLARIPTEEGLPDGCALDAEGYLWLALWGGSAVLRISTRDGSVVSRVDLPVSQVTSCCFGGPDLGALYITSAAVDLAPEQLAKEPHAGGLFHLRPGVPGLPTEAYQG